jgi:GGDEF domain-containing protein
MRQETGWTLPTWVWDAQEEGARTDELIRRADRALYEAKARRRPGGR